MSFASLKRLAGVVVVAALPMAVVAADNAPADKPVVEKLVDTMETLAGGPTPGYRSNHAKGVLVTGTFTPAPGAKALSKAPHFARASVPVIARFSDASAAPKLPDASPDASPHGLALRFTLPGDRYTDIVAISTNGFPVATPDDFLAMLQAVAATTPQSPKPAPIETFLGSHPKALAWVQLPMPAPVSFATLPFYGVNAFEFTNAKGDHAFGRYRIEPVAGMKALSETDAKTAGPNYLMDELPKRLAKGPVKFVLKVQLANPGDTVDDDTVVWSDDHRVVELGTITLTKAVADSAAREKQLFFNPLILTDGIAPSNDPILLARPAAYAVSVGRRIGK